MGTNTTKTEATFTLPLGDCEYKFCVEAISCTGKGPRSDPSQLYKAVLQDDPSMNFPRFLLSYVSSQKRPAFQVLPLTTIKASKDEYEDKKFTGALTIMLFESVFNYDTDLNWFPLLWRLLTGDIKLALSEPTPKPTA